MKQLALGRMGKMVRNSRIFCIRKGRTMRLLSVIAAFAIFLPNFASAQEVGENCGINPFATGGCITPEVGESGGTQAYVGVQLTVGSTRSINPKFVVGVRSTEVSDGGRVTGADLALRLSLGDENLAIDSAVISVLRGNDDMLGGLGIGYSYAHSSWLASGSAERNAVRLGADYAWSAGVAEYFAEITLKSELEEGGIACPADFNERTIDSEEPFPEGDDEAFFVLSPDLLVGKTTCEPEDFGFVPPS